MSNVDLTMGLPARTCSTPVMDSASTPGPCASAPSDLASVQRHGSSSSSPQQTRWTSRQICRHDVSLWNRRLKVGPFPVCDPLLSTSNDSQETTHPANDGGQTLMVMD